MQLKLKVWRQKNKSDRGHFEDHQIKEITPDMSFLEMLDILNEQLIIKGKDPIAFDHDCREGICGSCSLVINGNPHGPDRSTTTCQLHMRRFRNGDTIVIEPFRAQAFPVIKDLVVDRSSFDRIIQAGGYISVNTGGAPDANALPISKENADAAFTSAACIGCGACVAACKNSSALLFVGAKLSHLKNVPQGQAERARRALGMVAAMDSERFGSCTHTGSCSASCPKDIPLSVIAELNREYMVASFVRRGDESPRDSA